MSDWQRISAPLAPAARTCIGLVLLGTDRVSHDDVGAFLPDDVEVYSTRVPMDPVATPETLAAMERHLEQAAAALVPGAPLDAIGFSCTSGSVAIGPARVRERIQAGRPGMPVANPVDAAADALLALGARRIALLVPYLDGPANLIRDYIGGRGIESVSSATFDLDGDPEMNRVPDAVMVDAATDLVRNAGDVDALFISCTGLRTAPIVAELEQALSIPVVTSNQAHAWALLRLAGREDSVPRGGRLFEFAGPVGD